MNRKFAGLIVCITLLLSISCSTSKEVITEKPKKLPPEFLLEQINQSEKHFEWFSAKAKVNYNDGSRSRSFTVNIRMKEDSVIWASITSLMGVEAARVLITSDTVHILDRMNKQYFKKSFIFLENYVAFTLNLNILQGIIVGNAIINDENKVKSKVNKDHHILVLEDKTMENTLWIEPKNYNISTEHLVDKQLDRNLTLIFSNYKSDENIEFAYQRKINFVSTDQTEIDLKFSRIKWNERLTFPFFVSNKYENRF